MKFRNFKLFVYLKSFAMVNGDNDENGDTGDSGNDVVYLLL